MVRWLDASRPCTPRGSGGREEGGQWGARRSETSPRESGTGPQQEAACVITMHDSPSIPGLLRAWGMASGTSLNLYEPQFPHQLKKEVLA